MSQIDTRLIQTAVIGGRDSDQPVILPEQPHNLDEFLASSGGTTSGAARFSAAAENRCGPSGM
ncbi:hypothetical protein OHA79_02845 [Streptomyces sp. NBC_00841]|uniref:hypothetical protein n=1 Tax=Streptomyces sp. NBC_00841 TaxID=2975847 RepID=UPI002DDBBAD0|nr:hypothetical protein [Streptomyces sp. NBC_00841]WRZ96957.1 hypothetical protein OHA79_02845 [Streptomyces sp. NBC_00841]